MAHQLTLLKPRPKAGDVCPCIVGTYELEHGRLVCRFCGFRPESVVVARWNPEARR